MIFASDLDRTLIYSKRAINELGKPEETKLKPVEKKEGNWVAYMSNASFLALKELARRYLFVPVTTRTTEQFNRFVIFGDEIWIKYAITANGACILYDGKPMAEWSEHILHRLQSESVQQDELLSLLKREGFRFTGQMKQAEKLFFYFILNNLLSKSAMQAIHDFSSKYGWRTSLQGRKLYFIPQSISKGSALEYICQLEGEKAIAGAGDSILDWDFLQNCNYRIVPKHGELAGLLESKDYTLTTETGVKVGEEIIQHFLNLTRLTSTS